MLTIGPRVCRELHYFTTYDNRTVIKISYIFSETWYWHGTQLYLGLNGKKNGILKFCAFCILCSKKKNLGGCVSYIREQIRKVVDYSHGYDPWIRNAPLIQNLPTVFRSTQDTICILSPSSCSIIILLFKYIYNRSINSEYLGIMPYFVPIVSRIMNNILSHQQKYLKYLRAQKKKCMQNRIFTIYFHSNIIPLEQSTLKF